MIKIGDNIGKSREKNAAFAIIFIGKICFNGNTIALVIYFLRLIMDHMLINKADIPPIVAKCYEFPEFT